LNQSLRRSLVFLPIPIREASGWCAINSILGNLVNQPQIVYKRFERGIWVINFVGVLNAMAISMSLPFMALYLYDKRGISMAMIGVIILVSGLGSGIASLFGGSLCDRLGRKPLLIATLTLSFLMFVGMAVLIGYRAPVIVIVVAYTLVRSGLAMQRPAIQAIVIDLTPRERLAEAYGLMRIGGNLGFAIGPAIGGFLAAYLSYAWIFGLAGVIMGLAMLFILFSFKESFSQRLERVGVASVFQVARNRNLLAFTLFSLLLFLVMGQLSSTLSVYSVNFAGFSTAQYGYLLTLNGAIIVIFQYPFSRLVGRNALYRPIMLGALLYAVGYLLLSWVGDYKLALLSMMIITAGEIVFAPTSSAVVGEMASESWRARYMAFFGLSETLGWALGPLIGGVMLDRFPAQPLVVWGSISALAVIALVGFWRWGLAQTVQKLVIHDKDNV
jgi:predicted MFS family arabinose efflux permease